MNENAQTETDRLSLIQRLRCHIALLGPHQAERRTAKLLIEATNELERIHAAIRGSNYTPDKKYVHTQ